MKKENILNMSITEDAGWFILENENMDQKVFSSLVDRLYTIISNIYEGTKPENNKNDTKEDKYVKKTTNEKGEIALKVTQKKVPHIIKGLVQDPNVDIKINLKGLNPQREVVSRIIDKPFTANQVTELVPCYHGVENAKDQSNQQKNKRIA